MILSIIKSLFGSGLFGEVRKAYTDTLRLRLDAQNNERRVQLDRDLERMESAVRLAEIARGDPWSATSLGRYLIVVPFGVWWSLIFADSIFAFEWDVLALPGNIMAMAEWLVPAIIIGDVANTGIRRFRA